MFTPRKSRSEAAVAPAGDAAAAAYFKSIAPDRAQTAEVAANLPLDPPPTPAELAAVVHAAPKRQAEFVLGRRCARRAISALGVPTGPLEIQPDRAVGWPPGVVGSISHTEGYCAAVAAHTSDLLGIGIDVEVVDDVGIHLWPRILSAAELDRSRRLSPRQGLRRAALTFSAKEALFKCLYPSTRRWLNFEEVTVIAAGGDLAFDLPADLDARIANGVRGRYRFAGAHVFTMVAWGGPPQSRG